MLGYRNISASIKQALLNKWRFLPIKSTRYNYKGFPIRENLRECDHLGPHLFEMFMHGYTVEGSFDKLKSIVDRDIDTNYFVHD